MKLTKMAVLSAIVTGSLWSLNASAQFQYNNGDLLLGIRNGGSSDLVVDIGSAANYVNATGPITISGTYFTYNQLTNAVGGSGSLDNMYFSIFGNDNNANTLWASRTSNGNAWSAQSYLAQGNTVSKMDGVGNSAADYGSLPSHFGPYDTATSLVEPDGFHSGSDASYAVLIGGAGTFNTFQGNIETLTPGGFTAGTDPVVANLYQLVSTTDINGQPNGNAGSTLLGQFVFSPSGSLVFNPTAVPEPATWGMFGAGMLALAAIRRIRRNS